MASAPCRDGPPAGKRVRTHVPAPSRRIGTSRRTPVPENPAPTAPRMPPGSTSRPAASCVAGGVGAMQHRLSPRLCRARGLHPPLTSASLSSPRSIAFPPSTRIISLLQPAVPVSCLVLPVQPARLPVRNATSGSPPRGRPDSSSFAALAGPIRRELPGENLGNLLNGFTSS